MHAALSQGVLKNFRRAPKSNRRFGLLSGHVTTTVLCLIKTMLQHGDKLDSGVRRSFGAGD